MARTRKKELDAVELLKKDHREVEKLFKEFEKLHEAEEHEAADQIVQTACVELQIHDKLETEIFYPAVREQAQKEEEELLDEAEVEHNTVRQLIETLQGMEDPEDEKKHAHFTVLIEYVKHHVKEEEKEMFPKVKKLDLDLNELGAQMKERKTELMSEMGVEVEEEESAETT